MLDRTFAAAKTLKCAPQTKELVEVLLETLESQAPPSHLL